jgi:hypothetical protein
LLDDQAQAWTSPFHADAGGQLLDRFALVESGGQDRLAGAVSTLTATGDGLVVVVLAEVDAGAATALARLGRQGSRGLALLLRTTDWADLPAHRVAELDAQRAHAAAVLAAGGWSVAECAAADSPASAWARLLGAPRGSAAVAPPAAGSSGAGSLSKAGLR